MFASLSCVLVTSVLSASHFSIAGGVPLIEAGEIAWINSIDKDLRRSILVVGAMWIDGEDPEPVVAWPFLILPCLGFSWACYNDADEMNAACHDACQGDWPAPGIYDMEKIAACEDCCNSVCDGDYFNCAVTCGANGPDQPAYDECWKDIHEPHAPPGPVPPWLPPLIPH